MTSATAPTQFFEWGNDAVRLHFAHAHDRPPSLLAVLPADSPAPDLSALLRSSVPVVELEVTGQGKLGTSGKRHLDGGASRKLRLASWQEEKTNELKLLRLDLTTTDESFKVAVHYELAAGIPVLRTWCEVEGGDLTLEFASSLVLSGLGHGTGWETDLALWQAANPWSGEFRWRRDNLAALGLVDVGMVAFGQTGSKNRVSLTSTGSWSTSEYLPMGILEDARTGAMLGWAIEHNGAWHYELGDHHNDVYLSLSGPTQSEHQWSQQLQPGQSFRTVSVSLAVGNDLDQLAGALTAHRRRIRRQHPDSAGLPIVYNDFLNALMADPSTDRILPLVEAAAELGAEIYCIDAGWYDDENGGWWDAVGAWEPSVSRFPGGGLGALIGKIRAAGLRPGLWLEPEVIGVRSTVASVLPDEAFFQRDGRRVVEWGRYQLDLRHSSARQHLDAVVDRLMSEFDLAYLKLDYNIDIGAGTDLPDEHGFRSTGAGLLGHNRAFLDWVNSVMDRYPALTIEGCAAGGSRTDAATGAVFPLQSLTDQQDYRLMPPIAAAAPLAITPEQAGIWASVDGSMTDEQLAFSLITSLLGRIHLAGRIDTLSASQRTVVRAALDTYRAHRHLLTESTPTWPLGLPAWRDDWLSVGAHTQNHLLLSVWRRGGPPKLRLPLPTTLGPSPTVTTLFPPWANDYAEVVTDVSGNSTLELSLPKAPSARLLRISAQ